MGSGERTSFRSHFGVRGSFLRASDTRLPRTRQLLKTSALSTAALALSGITIAHADSDGLWQPQVRAVIGADNHGASTALEGFIPLKQTAESVLFLDVRGKHRFDDGFGQDVGIGVRRLVNPDLLVGGYAYANVQTVDGHTYSGATLGIEAITANYDGHLNVYVPFGGDGNESKSNSSLSLVGNQLLEQISVLDRRSYSAWGIEGEFGVQVPLELPENHSLRLDVGGYHFADPDGRDGSVTGAKAGIEYAIRDAFSAGWDLTLTGEVRSDNRDHTQFAGSIQLSVPFNPPTRNATQDEAATTYPVGDGLRKRVNERVRGDIGVRVNTQETKRDFSRNAVNAATGKAFGTFFFADGENTLGLGTQGDPTTLDDAVAKAGKDGFVVALGGKGNILTAGAILAQNQTVIGGAGTVKALTFSGSIETFSFGGLNGTVAGTDAGKAVLSLADGNTISGITVTGGGIGISGVNINGAALTDVTVSATGSHGVSFTGNSTGVTGTNLTSSGNGGDGLHIESDGTFNFAGTTLLSGNAGDGLDIKGKGTYAFATLNALNNAGDGIHVSGTSTTGRFSTTGGTVSGNGGTGVFVDPITARITLGSVSQNGGTSGIVLENVSGSFTITGPTTISNTNGDAISITNSSATVSFLGGVLITNPASGFAGVDIEGNNGAISFANLQIALQSGNSTGLDLSSALVNGNITAIIFNLTSTTPTGTVGINLVGASGIGTVRLGDTNAVGANASIGGAGGNAAGPGTGVLLSAATSLNFIFGDGEAGTDVGSTITAATPIAATDTLPLGGSYNFLDARLVGNTSNLATNVSLYYVDNVTDGIDDGSRDHPGTILGAMNSTAAVIVLVDRTGADVIDTNAAAQGAQASLLLDNNQRLMSFLGGDTINVGGGAPANFLLTGIDVGKIINPFAGTGSPTLTTTAAANTVTLGNANLIEGVQISNGAGAGSVSGAGSSATLRNSAIGGLALNAMSGTVTVDNTTLDQLTVAGGSVAVVGTKANLVTGANVAALSVTGGHSGSITFDAASSILTSNGSGLQFDNADGIYGFNGITTLAGGDAGIDILNGSAGSFTFGTGASIASPSGTAFNVNSSAATLTFAGSLTQNSVATAISVTNNAGGTITLGGMIVATTSSADAILFQGNSATTTLSLNGGLDVNTTSGAGLLANAAGTINIAATSGAENISVQTGQAVDLTGVTANIALDLVHANGSTNAISLMSVDGAFAVSNSTTVLSTGNDGIRIVQSAANVSFGGTTTITDTGGNGIYLQDNTGTVIFNGTTTIGNPGAAASGVAIKGANAAITFDSLAIDLAQPSTTGVDMSSAVLAGNITVTDFDLTSSSATGTIGIDISGVTSPNSKTIFIGDPSTPFASGQSATIAGVNTGVLVSPTTNIGFTFGDGEAGQDVGSTISATTPIRSTGALPALGTYNFLDVNLVGDTTNLSTNVSVYYVDDVTDGIDDGSRDHPGTIVGALAAVGIDAIVLVNNPLDGDGTIDISSATQGSQTTVLLDANQRLYSFNENGSTINVGGGAPGTFLLTGISNGTLTNPGTGTPTLTSSAGLSQTITLNDSNTIDGIIVSNSLSASINGFSTSGGVISNSNIVGRLRLDSAIGTVTITNTAMADFHVDGGSINVNGTNADISKTTSGEAFRATSGHTGTISFDAASSVTATSGTGFRFDNADGSYSFLGNNTLNGDDAGIDIINGSAGTFVFSTAGSTTTTITNPTGVAFNVDASTATVTYNGNITQTTNPAALVNVTNHSGGTITFQNGTLNATTGTGLQFSNADGIYTFNGTTTLNGGDAGVDIIGGSGGTFTFGIGASITSPSGIAFNVAASAATVTYNGTITQNNAASAVSLTANTGGAIAFGGAITANTTTATAISVANNTGGIFNFNGQVTTNTSSGTGVLLDTNTGATINFTGGLDITTAGGDGFTAINNGPGLYGGTVTITGAGNTIASGGNGLLMGGMVVGAGGIAFDSISAKSVNPGGAGVALGLVDLQGDVNIGGLKDTGFTGGVFAGLTGPGKVNLTGTIDLDLTDPFSIGFDFGGQIGTVNIANVTGSTLTIDGAWIGIQFSGAQGGTANIGSVGSSATITAAKATGSAIALNSNTIGGPVLNYTGALNVSAGAVVSTGGADLAVLNLAGTVTSTTTDTAFNFAVASGTYNISSSISHTGGTGVNVGPGALATGTITFSGASKAFSTGTNTAVSMAGLGTLSFTNGGLGITTSSGTGLSATAGTVNVSGATGNTVNSTAGTAVSLSSVTAGVTLNSITAAGGTNGVALSNVTGSFSVSGATQVSNTTGTAISASNSAAALSFNGGTTVTNSGADGIALTGNSGAVSFLGTTTITNPATAAVNINGTNGVISFADLDIALTAANTTGFDVSGAVVNANITATDFDLTSASATGTVGVNLVGTTGTGLIQLGDASLPFNAGHSATIAGTPGNTSGPTTGVLMSSTTNVDFIFGDGEGGQDVGSSIIAVTPIAATDTLPNHGTDVYNFLDATLTGDTSNLSSPFSVYYVDNFNDGTNNGSRSNPGTIAGAIASGRDIIVLVNNGGNIDVSSALQGSGTTLTLLNNQRLYSFLAGDTINVGGGAPASFLLTGVDSGNITNPATGTPTLTTSTAATNTVTLANNNVLQGVLITSGPGGYSVSGTGINTLTVTNSNIGGLRLDTATGMASLGDTVFSHIHIIGGGVTVSGTNADINSTTAVNAFDISGTHTGNVTFDAASAISQTGAARGVSITGKTAGTVTFGGLVTANTGSADGVFLNGNTGATINFNGGLDVDTTTGTGFTATGGGTINAIGAGNTINSTGGQAINLASITSNISLASIVAGGGARGISLDTVTGSFTVSGTTNIGGVTDAGIQIQNSSANAAFTGKVTILNGVGANGDGVWMDTNTGTYDFNGGVDITVNGTGAFGLRAHNSGTVNIANVAGNQITSNNGTALSIDPMAFNATFDSLTAGGGTNGVILDQMTGSLTVTGAITINNSTGDGLVIANSAGTVTLGSVAINGTGGDGIDISGTNGAIIISGGSIGDSNDPGGIGVKISGGTAAITINASVAKTTAGDLIEVTGRTAGTVSFNGNLSSSAQGGGIDVNGNSGTAVINFSGATKTINTSASGVTAVSLAGNGGATVSFLGGGLAISSGAGTGFSATGGGTINVTAGANQNTITTTTGSAVNLDGVVIGAGNVAFDTTNKTATGGTSAVVLNTVTGGSIDLGGGTLNGGSGAVVRIGDGAGGANTGGTAGFAYGGNIISGTGQAVNIQDRAATAQNITLSGNITHGVSGQTGILLDDNAAGTITFSGASKSISSGSATAVSLTDNGGATISFLNGGLNVTATGTGFLATGGGTINVVSGAGTDIITTTTATGTGVDLNGIVIGAGNIGFTTVNVDGAATGIRATNVTGGSLSIGGGTIQNTTTAAIDISGGSSGVTISNMTINNSAGRSVSVASRGGGSGAISFSGINLTDTGLGMLFQNNSGGSTTFSGGGTRSVNVAGANNALTVINSASHTVSFGGTTTLQATGTGNAVDISNGATLAFTGTAINANGTGAALQADGGGTVVITGTGAINAGATATAISLDTVAVGAGGITFASTSKTAGGTNAVVMNNVTGTGVVNLGTGTLNATTGAVIGITGGTAGLLYSGNVNQTNNAALLSIANHTTGTVTFQTGTLNATNGSGLQFDNADGIYNFNATTTLNGGDAGIDIINGSNGAFTFAAGTTITNPSGAGFLVNGGNGNISYSGTISKNNAGRMIDIQSRNGGTMTFSGNLSATVNATGGIFASSNSGGTFTFSGTTKTLSPNGRGVDLLNNSGATFNFTNGGLAITTTTQFGFNASGGGTITVQGSNNTIGSGTGGALNVVNTTIGALGLNFRSIASNGAANGIILNNTGTLGGLTVTGDGAAANNGSGGTIQNSTGDGISLTNTTDFHLARMNITNNLGDGIGGSTINGMVLDRLNISGNGDDAGTDESGINIVDLTGTASGGAHRTAILNSVISNNYEFEIQITNHSGTLTNLQFTNNNVTANDSGGVIGNVFNFLGDGTSTMGLTVSGGSFTGNYNPASPPANPTGTGLHADTSGTAMTVNVSGATFTGNNAGINVSTGPGSSALIFDLDNNTFVNQRSTAINIFNNGNAPFTRTVNGTITNNIIGNGADFSGSTVGRGIDVGNEGAVNLTVLISGNTIQDIGTPGGAISTGSAGIGSNIGLVGSPTGGGTTNLTITNNTISDIQDSRAVLVDESNGATGPQPTVFVNISGNTFSGFIGGQAGDGSKIRLDQDNGTFRVTQGAPASGAASLEAVNTGVTDVQISVGGTVSFNQGTPPLPTTNPLPLLAAPGGVEAQGDDLWGDVLTGETLDTIIAAAIQRWAATGLTDEQLAALNATTFQIADLGGNYLGLASGNVIRIDDNGNGLGWYVDVTPLSDEEFANRVGGTLLFADGTAAPAGQYDLLTTVMHEFGHVLGLGDLHTIDDSSDLMRDALTTGERRLPSAIYTPRMISYQATFNR
ncbi:hypothetical protein [Mesorhizobium sp. Pch-S]|uniref:hypothetical protein n=1 Tax=Mesorhizobium sp. Pch-S TaxID=2082387 RepID=UPI0010132522|nr:hypothetical protein [Mesorhizobium sp. Pch-S]